MPLSSDLISQFVKATKDTASDKTPPIVYGTVVFDGRYYVHLDGAPEELLTPVSTTTDIHDNDRVTVTIKDHEAIVTGNVTSPSARTEDVQNIGSKISEFEIVRASKVTARDLEVVNAAITNLRTELAKIAELEVDNADITSARIDELESKFAEIDYLTADDIEAINLLIYNIEGTFANFDELHSDVITAMQGEITNLKGYTADFTYVSAEVLEAVKAKVRDMTADKLDANFANIDYANIENATIEDLYAKFGLIENATMKDGYVTGKLVAVEINGDFIRSGTIQAERLLILGQDGLYYQLNVNGGMDPTFEEVPTDSIHGSIIAAKSITADQIHVTDLNAFGAKIGGFTISKNAIYSHLKPGVNIDADGLYMDDEGQLSLGGGDSYLRYYKDGFTYRPNAQDPGEITDEIKASATFVEDFDQTTKAYSYVDANQVTRYFLLNIEDNIVTPVDQVDRYRLAISADALYFGEDSKLHADQLKSLTERIKIGKTVDEVTGDEKPCIELSEGDTNFKQVITNVKTMFLDGSDVKTEINTDGLKTENVTVKREFRQAGFVWAGRDNGNYGLTWMGGGS